MKKVTMYDLKQDLAAAVAEAQSGTDILITRHSKAVARLTRPEIEHVHRGSRFGNADLRPVVRAKTGGRYLQLLEEDRLGGRE
jgi:antitoxin (DNA-binding transcriptional repressor) of toxin-antitoxin stability system